MNWTLILAGQLSCALFWYACSRFLLKASKMQSFLEDLLVFLLPGAGILLMLLYHGACSLLHLHRRVRNPKRRPVHMVESQLALDHDIIPLNDVWLVSDTEKRRRFFTDSIRQATIDNQQILQMAMHNPDREIAYYAVSLQTTRMEKLENELFQKAGILQEEITSEKQLKQLDEYASMLHEYLSNKSFVDHVTWRNKQADYISLLRKLLALRPENNHYYITLAEELMDVHHYQEAAAVCKAFKKRFPQCEEPYLLYIRLAQATRNPEKLQHRIDELKALPIELSQEALRVLRFWDKGRRTA